MRTLLALCGSVAAVKVTPIQKVIALLGKLETQMTEEGKAEAASYDKFACFCKKQADDKLYAITKADEKIERLTAEIEKLTAEIAEHDNTVAEETAEIDTLTAESESEVAQRKSDREAYEKKQAQFARAISACENAVKALMETGGSRALIQTTMEVARVVADDEDLSKLDQAPAQFEYSSAEIISTLQGLVATFKEKKKTHFETEAAEKQTHDLSEQTRQQEIKVSTEMKETNERQSADKNAQKDSAQDTKDATTADRNADQAFMDDLAGQCEAKAKSFDGRSQSRAAELKAIAEALDLLRGDGQKMFGANKKLTAVQKKAVVTESEDFDEEETSFVQLEGISDQDKRVMQLLSERAKVLKSTVLASFTVRLQADHFKKVRALIKDLVARLEDQAEAEATKQAACETDMNNAMTDRDDSQIQIEKLNGDIARASAFIAERKEDIRVLSEEIASLQKALAEATELREEEKAENNKTIADAKAGKAAVSSAMDTLNEYYANAFLFIQTEARMVTVHKKQPTHASDKDGNTVQDLAPETFENEDYRGGQEQSKGIIGLLEVIEEDYARTIQTTQDDEAASESEFQTFKGETETSIADKESLKETKEQEKMQKEEDKMNAEDELSDEKENNANAKEQLEILKADCVDTEVSYEERVKRREQEIASLKEALKILEEMGFLQKRA